MHYDLPDKFVEDPGIELLEIGILPGQGEKGIHIMFAGGDGLCQRAYKKYFARTKKGTMSKADFLAWETESERLREEALLEYDRARTEEERKAVAETLARELNRA